MALVSKWTLDNTYNDNETAANNLAAAGSGNSFVTSPLKMGSHSLQLNGSGYASKTSGVSGITTGNADRSMGGWFNPTTASAVEGIMAVGNAAANQGFLIIKLSATSIRIDLYADSQNFTVPSMSNSTWYWVWAEYTASTKTANLYLNNTVSSSGPLTFGSNSNLVTNHIYLGANEDAALLFTGNLDQMQFWNGVTSAGDRAAIFAEPNPATNSSWKNLMGVGI